MTDTRFFTHEAVARETSGGIQQRMRAALQAIADSTPPTDEELQAIAADAKERECGFFMVEGKPGTLRAHAGVPTGSVIIMKPGAAFHGA